MPAGYAMEGAVAPKKKKNPGNPLGPMFGAGMQDESPLGTMPAPTTGAMTDLTPGPDFLGGATAGVAPGGQMGMAPGAAPTNPFAALLAGLTNGMGAGGAPGGGVDLASLLRQMQAERDPVGRHNNRSNLPSNAAGSTSPFATGFFKPRPAV